MRRRIFSGLLPALAALLLTPLLPRGVAGQEEEERYAPAEVLGCDLVFAVLAATAGEPRSVRRCPRADGGRDLFFAPGPLLDLRHVDSVAVAAADSGFRQVVVRLTDEGVRRMQDLALVDEIGVVLDGRVVARFTPRVADPPSRLTVLSRASPERAERVAARLREEAARAVERSGG